MNWAFCSVPLPVILCDFPSVIPSFSESLSVETSFTDEGLKFQAGSNPLLDHRLQRNRGPLRPVGSLASPPEIFKENPPRGGDSPPTPSREEIRSLACLTESGVDFIREKPQVSSHVEQDLLVKKT